MYFPIVVNKKTQTWLQNLLLLALTIEGEFGLFRDLTRARDFIVILQLHEKIKILFQLMNCMNFFMSMDDDVDFSPVTN